MEEYVTDALVLAKAPMGERDGRYTLFAERFGKISAKVKSSRAIRSKLAGHLEPGTRVRVRFIDTGSLQIVDALKSAHTEIAQADLDLLKEILPDMQADADLWYFLEHKPFSWDGILRILGWDPRGARCSVCGRKVSRFSVARQEFFCGACVSKIGRDGVLYINVDP
jgi:recombinational DNA repair protein (RecF pathway)